MKKTILASAALAFASVSAPASAAVFTFNGSGGSISDFQTFASTINVASNFVVTDVNVILNGLKHTYWADLGISLTHGATVVDLSSHNGGSSDPNGNFIFDDSASTSATSINTSGGTFRPETPLSAFNGASSIGAWTLKINDDAWFDSGSLQNWSIQLSGNTAPAVPEPATWAMMIIGFGAVGGVMRRRNKVTVSYA